MELKLGEELIVLIVAFCGCTNLSDIQFDGTMSEWNKIEKNSRWRMHVPAKGVVCTNGFREFYY